MSKTATVTINNKIVKLEKVFGGWWGLCPFHKENTPSFSITREGCWYCFGCKRSGNIASEYIVEDAN